MTKLSLVFMLYMSLMTYPIESTYSSEYDIDGIYEAVDAEYGTRAVTNMGSLVDDIDFILVRTRVDEGTYTINLTRKDSNLYKIEGTNLYIITKYCYEFCYNEEVSLRVYNAGRYSYGKVIFD